MSGEIVEKGYSHSVESVARELIAEPVTPDKMTTIFINHPLIKEYLLSFREIMSAGYESCRDDFSFSYKVIDELKKSVIKHKETDRGIVSAPWMVALAILTNDESIKKVSDTRLRLIFDLSMGIVLDDNFERTSNLKRNAAYVKDSKQKEKMYGYLVAYSTFSKEWGKLQDKLREQISPADGTERK